ncbi:MAG TPA: hypothetical protein VGM29_03555 [Polyangiaceae bacterium]
MFDDASSLQIVIGPLPARWRRLAFALFWLIVVGGCSTLALRTERFECARLLGQHAHCTFSESAPLPLVVHFGPGSITAVEMVARTEGKARSPNVFTVDVLDPRGGELQIERFSTAEQATLERDRVRAFLADDAELALSREHRPGLGAFAAVAGVFAIGFGVLVNAFWCAGSLHLRVDRAKAEIFVWRTLFGLRRGALGRFPLQGVVDVRLERGAIRDGLRTRGQLPETGARLLLVSAEGSAQALTPDCLPGLDAFGRGLDELRSALGLVARVPEARDPAAPDTDHGSLVARAEGSWFGSSNLGKLARNRWLQGYLVVITLSLLAGALMNAHASKVQGTLEIQAESRCKFDGAEILPGGSLSMTLDPRRYTIEVFDPRAPDHWQTQSFEITRGVTTRVHCRPSTRR